MQKLSAQNQHNSLDIDPDASIFKETLSLEWFRASERLFTLILLIEGFILWS